MFASPYSFSPSPRPAIGGTTLGDIQIGLPTQAGIPAAPTGFYVPPGYKHLFYADNGGARAESGPLLMRAAAPGVGWLPDVVPTLRARVGDSAADWTGTRWHLLRVVQDWGNKGLFTVLIAQQALGEYGSYPDLDSMTFEAIPAKDIHLAKNQPGVFIVGLPGNEPSTAVAWAKYTGGGATTTTPGGTPPPTKAAGKCPPKGVWTGNTCDCRALGPTAQFDTESFLCVDCGPNTVPYKQGSEQCDCLPGFVPYGTAGGGCVPAAGQVTPLPIPTTPPPAVGTGNPLSDWWNVLTPRQKNVAAVTGLVSGGVLAWLFLHGTRDRAPSATSYDDDWAYQDTWRDSPRSAGAAPKTWVSPR